MVLSFRRKVAMFYRRFSDFIQPVSRNVSNHWSYYRYVLRRFSWSSFVKLLGGPIVTGISVYSLMWGDCKSGKLLDLALPLIGLIIGAFVSLYYGVKSFDDKYLYQEKDDDAYKNVEPPSGLPGWKKKTIRILNGEGKVVEESDIYTNDDIDQWLYDGAVGVRMERDRKYEKDLKKKIRARFDDIYKPFLRHNYKKSLFYGRQFTNEKKWGISQEFNCDTKTIRVHKTSYFDTYLTNIIPGSQLWSARYEKVMVQVNGEGFMPYIEQGGERHLLQLGHQSTANELGVTTLCFLGETGAIPLWRQTHQTQSSSGQLVATGSGSADWNDCDEFLKSDKSFHKAIVRGMERELWEEAVKSSRAVKKKDFYERTQTKITGYFRWLSKGGKSEFVGVSQVDIERLLDKISAEESEVAQGKLIQSPTVFSLKEALGQLVKQDSDKPDEYISHDCSISCAVAILALHAVCERTVCAGCALLDKCSGDVCKKQPTSVLFATDAR
ncbi:MAG: hypothetical protein IKZ87_06465 [Actinomycetaceae bacterium]|nr:hypothetical protein [Actinomycetaceae bacterium]